MNNNINKIVRGIDIWGQLLIVVFSLLIPYFIFFTPFIVTVWQLISYWLRSINKKEEQSSQRRAYWFLVKKVIIIFIIGCLLEGIKSIGMSSEIEAVATLMFCMSYLSGAMLNFYYLWICIRGL